MSTGSPRRACFDAMPPRLPSCAQARVCGGRGKDCTPLLPAIIEQNLL